MKLETYIRNQQLAFKINESRINCSFQTIISLSAGTCSDRATTYLCSKLTKFSITRIYANSFTQALIIAEREPSSILLVPHLHEVCQYLSLNSDWRTIDDLSFFLQNPPLYIANRPGLPADKCPKYHCATVSALTQLFGYQVDAQSSENRFLYVDNTQLAAKACSSDHARYCITNEAGLTNFGLAPVAQLKEITVWWLPFRNTRS